MPDLQVHGTDTPRESSHRVRQAHLLIVVLGPGHLVAVDGHSCDLSAACGGDRAHGAAHAAAHVQALLARPQLQQRSQARLVRGLRGCPVLPGEPWGEVEALQGMGHTSHARGISEKSRREAKLPSLSSVSEGLAHIEIRYVV